MLISHDKTRSGRDQTRLTPDLSRLDQDKSGFSQDLSDQIQTSTTPLFVLFSRLLLVSV